MATSVFPMRLSADKLKEAEENAGCSVTMDMDSRAMPVYVPSNWYVDLPPPLPFTNTSSSALLFMHSRLSLQSADAPQWRRQSLQRLRAAISSWLHAAAYGVRQRRRGGEFWAD